MNNSKITLNFDNIPIKIYSDGSVDTLIPAYRHDNPYIEAALVDASGIIALLQVLSTLKDELAEVNVALLYLPNARQEREQEVGDDIKPNTFKAFARALSTYKDTIKSLTLLDPHSSLNVSILEECGLTVKVLKLVDLIPDYENIDYVIAPDKGAKVRAGEVATKLNVPLIIADKVRDPVTHEIKLTLDTDVSLEGKSVLALDDILDYGTSLYELSKALKQDYKVGHISAFVTHAILPNNLRLTPPSRSSYVLEYVDHLSCYNLFNTEGDIEGINYQNLLGQ